MSNKADKNPPKKPKKNPIVFRISENGSKISCESFTFYKEDIGFDKCTNKYYKADKL